MTGDHPSSRQVRGEAAMLPVLTPALWIVVAAAALGLAVNAARERDAIEFGRSYFAAPPPVPAAPKAMVADPQAPATAPRRAAPGLQERAAKEFTVIETARAFELFEAARLDPSHVQFVDARSEGYFRKDHLPGALQLDYYNLRRDIAPALPFLHVIPWLVVYCESAECEDGFLLCRALRDDYGIPRERVLLYIDGIRDWRERRLPVVRGSSLW